MAVNNLTLCVGCVQCFTFIFFDGYGFGKSCLLLNLFALGVFFLGVGVVGPSLVHPLVVFQGQLVLAQRHVGGCSPVVGLEVLGVHLDGFGSVRQSVPEILHPEIGDRSVGIVDSIDRVQFDSLCRAKTI